MITNKYKEFIDVSSWFYIKNYGPGAMNMRYFTTQAALNLFLQNGKKTIIETGCMKEKDWGDGRSTALFAEVCQRYDRNIQTTDLSAEHIRRCKEYTTEFQDVITYNISDSVTFLRSFTNWNDVGMAYLDSLDVPLVGDATQSQVHQLNEFLAFEDKIDKGFVLLLDDNDFTNGGKAKLLKEHLIRTDEWMCILDYQQTLWLKMKNKGDK